MDCRELQRMRDNKKVKEFAIQILYKCADEQFSISDLKDLATIMQGIVGKVVAINEENQKIIPHLIAEVFPNNNVDTHLQNSENYQGHPE
ncbi:hypothetical protein [Sporofaciens musculi]|uniref:hypothetical protein n=1 Tax=Sporofaciens musculi TaxID=2681861 RepID=UPI0025A1ED89|nr:hypothetical protein [Sporofaciens musculi]